MTKDELLAKTQATIEEQQAKLESLKEKALDESQEAIDDVTCCDCRFGTQVRASKS